MLSRILIYVCALFGFIGICQSAEDSWYPKASDTCTSFSGESRSHGWTTLAQHPKLLWRDKKVFKLKSDFDAATNALSLKTDEGKSHLSSTGGSIVTLLVLSMYCDKHGDAILGDLSASDIINFLKSADTVSSNTSHSIEYKAATE